MSKIRSMVVGLLVVAGAAGVAEAQAPQRDGERRARSEAGRGRDRGLAQRGMRALFRDINLAPISNRFETHYVSKAEAEVSGLVIPVPTSIRVQK